MAFTRVLSLTLVLIAMIAIARPTDTLGAAGDVDATFVSAMLDLGGTSVYGGPAIVQPDGKIVVAGALATDWRRRPVVLARFDPSGALDASFGHEGVVTPDRDPACENTVGVALQPDGKILLLDEDFGLTRYTSDGVLDASFGDAGKLNVDPSVTIDGLRRRIYESSALVVRADGRILVGGVDRYSGLTILAVFQLHPDGSFDTSFGESGSGVFSREVRCSYPCETRLALDRDDVLATFNREGVVRIRQDGSVDTAFGDAGLARGPTTADRIQDLAVQADGRIVAVGNRFHGRRADPRTSQLAVRFTQAGALDPSFGDSGVYLGREGSWDTVAVQRDRILAAHYHSEVVALGRDGRPDRTFDVDGRIHATISGRFQLSTLVVGPDDEIVLAGSADDGRGRRELVVGRYEPDGRRDLAFGPHGYQRLPFHLPDENVVAVAGLPDGNLLVVGETLEPTTGTDGTVHRLLPGGAADPTFGAGGAVRVHYTVDDYREVKDNSVDVAAIQPNGKFLLAGSVYVGGHNGVYIVRLNQAGQRDPSFGSDGGAIVFEVSGGNDNITGIAVQSDGRIVFGARDNYNDNRPSFRRRFPDGSRDPSFGSPRMEDAGQRGTTPLWITRDDAILVGGVFGGVARLDADGNLDLDFGDGGHVSLEPLGFDRNVIALVQLRSGRIVVAAGYRATDFTLVGLDPAGAIDPAFGDGGIVTTDFGSDSEWVSTLAVQSDGKIVALGGSEAAPGIPARQIVARYTADGALDSTFGSGGVVVLPTPPEDSHPKLTLGRDGSIYVAITAWQGTDYDASVIRLEGDAPSICGNGVVEPTEGCDDGNTSAGDGCDATCAVETCFRCRDEPSICSSLPGGDPACEPATRCPVPGDPDFFDPDGDGRAGACDLCPNVPTLHDQDGDGDGVGDACDLCLDDWDPTNADDGDGFGDVCDRYRCSQKVVLESAKLRVTGLDKGRGKARVNLRGALPLPEGLTFEQTRAWVEVRITDASGALDARWRLTDDGIPGTWSPPRSGSTWRFRSAAGYAPRVRVRLREDPSDPTRILFAFTARHAELGAPPIKLPLRAIVEYWSPCAKAIFADDGESCSAESTDRIVCSS